MEKGIVATVYKTDKKIYIYNKVGSVAENVMIDLGYLSDEYWLDTFEYEYCKKPAYKIKGKNKNG